MSQVEVSLVLPAFESAAYIGDNVRRVLGFFVEHRIRGEVVVSDDGSADGTLDAVPSVAGVHVLRLPHRGKGGALRAGMIAARGEIRAFTDADLPYGLDPLPAAVASIRERGAHAVIGDRTLPGSEYRATGLRRAVSAVAGLFFRTFITGGIHDTQCGFKVFRGDVAAEVFRLARVDGFAIDIEILYLLLGYRLEVQRVPVRLEATGMSSVHLVHDSLAVARDVALVRLRWAAGRYRSSVLERLATDERRADLIASE